MTESPDRSAEGEAILPDIGVLKPKLMQLARGSKLKSDISVSRPPPSTCSLCAEAS